MRLVWLQAPQITSDWETYFDHLHDWTISSHACPAKWADLSFAADSRHSRQLAAWVALQRYHKLTSMLPAEAETRLEVRPAKNS